MANAVMANAVMANVLAEGLKLTGTEAVINVLVSKRPR